MADQKPGQKPEGRTPGEIEAARKLFAGTCEFVAGAASFESLPAIALPEVAFAGRSNVGKSSLVNALTGRRTLARVSASPGATRQINFFDLAGRFFLVDLPGYGFAQVSKSMKESWQDLASAYLRGRPTLKRVCLLIDSRHGVKDSDHETMKNLDRAAVSYQLVLTKTDRLKAGRRAARRRRRRSRRPQAWRRASRGPADQQRDRLRHRRAPRGARGGRDGLALIVMFLSP